MGRTKWPLAAPTVRLHTKGEAVFAPLKGEVLRKDQPKAVRSPWIPKEKWWLADQRTMLLRVGRAITREVRKVRRDFQYALQEDRRRRVKAEW